MAMVPHLRFAVPAALFALAACRTTGPAAIDPGLASYLPEGITALGGIDLDHLRASPVYRKLPPATAATLEPLREASRALVAYDSRGVLLIARGRFSQPPSGAVLAESGIALAGSPEMISAATAHHRQKAPADGKLLPRATGVAANPVWLVVPGTAGLPFGGNAANLNRFLHYTEYLTVAASLGAAIDLEIHAVCRSAGEAEQFEESLRAMVSLASAARQSPLLSSVRIGRDSLTVKVTLSATPDDLSRLF